MSWSDTARLVDISHWQIEEDARTHHQLMDWAQAVQHGLVGVIIKYSQGVAGVDPAAFLHAYNAFTAGVPLLGGYHFGDGSDPEKQAAHFIDCMKQDYQGDLTGRMLMLDAEQNKPQMSVRQAEIFVAAVHDAIGRYPWLYMGKAGPDGTGKGLPSRILSNCPLLLPKYGPAPGPSNIPAGFRMPKDGQDRGEPGMGVMRGWQFTDGSINGGPFPGLGKVDQSRVIGCSSLDELAAIWAS